MHLMECWYNFPNPCPTTTNPFLRFHRLLPRHQRKKLGNRARKAISLLASSKDRKCVTGTGPSFSQQTRPSGYNNKLICVSAARKFKAACVIPLVQSAVMGSGCGNRGTLGKRAVPCRPQLTPLTVGPCPKLAVTNAFRQHDPPPNAACLWFGRILCW